MRAAAERSAALRSELAVEEAKARRLEAVVQEEEEEEWRVAAGADDISKAAARAAQRTKQHAKRTAEREAATAIRAEVEVERQHLVRRLARLETKGARAEMEWRWARSSAGAALAALDGWPCYQVSGILAEAAVLLWA